jgi:PAS domain S-box-containing protein
MNKEKVTFMNFELNITADDLIKKINLNDKERNQKIEMLIKILENSTDGYWDWHIGSGKDGEEDYEYLSPKFKEQLGYGPDELEDKPSSWMNLIYPECLSKINSKLQEHFNSNGEIEFMSECRYTHKDGHTVWILCRGDVIEWNEDGTPKRMVGTHTDITSLKQ